MPQLIFIGLVAIGGYFLWKTVRREMARVDRELKETRAEKSDKTATTLEQDPEEVASATTETARSFFGLPDISERADVENAERT